MGKGGGNGQGESTCHPVRNSLEVKEVAEASCAAACGLDDAVDGFDGRGGDAIGMECEDAIPMCLRDDQQFKVFVFAHNDGFISLWPSIAEKSQHAGANSHLKIN